MNGFFVNDSKQDINASIVGSLANLLTDVSTTGAGTPVVVDSYKNYAFEVWGTATTFDIKVQVVGPSGEAWDLKIWDELNNVFLTGGIVTKGIYSVSVTPTMSIQANVVSVSGGAVSLGGGLTT